MPPEELSVFLRHGLQADCLLLEDQLKLAAQREEELLKVIADQNEQLNILTAEVKSLNSSILSLEKALLGKECIP